MSRCILGGFGHNPTAHGEGCAGCDAEHARLMAKHVGTGPYVDPFDRGAAVAFGLMGMAEAIKRNYLCDQCGQHVGPLPLKPSVGLAFRCDCWLDG